MKRLLLLALCLSSIQAENTKESWLVKTKALKENTIVSGKIISLHSQGALVLLDGEIEATIPKNNVTPTDYKTVQKKQFFAITKINPETKNITVFSVDKPFIKKSITRSFDYQASDIYCAHITNMSGEYIECRICFQARIFHQNEWKTTSLCTKVLKMKPGQYYKVLLGNEKWPGTMPCLINLIDHKSNQNINASIVRDEYNDQIIYVNLTA